MRSTFAFVAVLVAAVALPAHAARMSAWVPSWDAAALDVMRLHAGKLDETNPGWYTMGRDGGIVKNWGAEDVNMLAALSGTAIMPTIKNYIDGRFDGAAVATVIGSEASRTAHVNAIVDLVVQRGYAGIDIDYEKIPTTSRDHFSAFVAQLADQLHRQNRLLSVTVHAKGSDADDWNGPGAQDWSAIGQAADSVKIMAYDYHWSTSAAGAIAPLAWLDHVASYGESRIPGGKMIVGLPWYGYDWSGTSGSGVTYKQAMATAVSSGATVGRDENQEATYAYSGRTVFFQDVTSYRAKVEYLQSRHPGIAGFAAWRVGAEDPLIWDVVGSLKAGGTASSPAKPSGDFIVSGQTLVSVVAGSSVSTGAWMTPIDGFTGSATASVRIDGFTGTATLDRTTIAPNEQALVTIHTTTATAAGSYRAVVTMTSGALVRELAIEVRVSAPVPVGDFTLSSSGAVTLAPSTSTAVDVALEAIDGFAGTAELVVRVTDGFRGSLALSSPTIRAGSPVTLTIAADRKAAAGRYMVEVIASSGAIVRSTFIEVTVPSVKRRALGH